jgi:hypothetical protein
MQETRKRFEEFMNLWLCHTMDETAVSGYPFKLTIFHQDLPPTDGYCWPASEILAFVGCPIYIFMQSLGGERYLSVRVKNNEIRIIPWGNVAFVLQAKKLCRGGTTQINPPLERE